MIPIISIGITTITIIAIVLIGMGAWEAIVHRNMGAMSKRVIAGLAIYVIFVPLLKFSYQAPPPLGNADEIYNSTVGALCSATGGTTAELGQKPGSLFVEKGVAVSSAIWAGITGSPLIYIPIAWCFIAWALALAKGGTWLDAGGKFVFWLLIWAIVAGPITSGFGMMMLKTGGEIAASVMTALKPSPNSAVKPVIPPEVGWINEAKSSAELPAQIKTKTIPFISSVQRALPANEYRTFMNEGALSLQSSKLLDKIYYTSVSGKMEDGSAGIQAAMPHSFQTKYICCDVNVSRYVEENFINNANELVDGKGITVGFISIGKNAALDIKTKYMALKTTKTAEVDRLIDANKDNAFLVAKYSVLKLNISRYEPPNERRLNETANLYEDIITSIKDYYLKAHNERPEVLTGRKGADPDALGMLFLTPAGTTAIALANDTINTYNQAEQAKVLKNPAYIPVLLSQITSADPLAEYSKAPPIKEALSINDTVDTKSSGSSGWNIVKAFFTLLIQTFAESGMAVGMLLIKVLVLLLGPIIMQLGVFASALGIFILCAAYPLAAYASLFPGRWTILLDWTKGVMWVMAWLPIMFLGMSLCAFNVSDISALATIALNSLPFISGATKVIGSAAGNAVPGIFNTGTITESYMLSIMGIGIVMASPMVANLIFNPGLNGIAGLAGMMMQTVGKTVGAGAAGLAPVGALAGKGAGAALKGIDTITSGKASAAVESISRGVNTGNIGGGGFTESLKRSIMRPGGRGGGDSQEDGAYEAAVAAKNTIQGAVGKVTGSSDPSSSPTLFQRAGNTAASAASSLTTAAAYGGSAMGEEQQRQFGQQIAKLKSMVSTQGPTPLSDRISQAIVAGSQGNILGASSMAQGHGAHVSNSDFRGAGGGGRGEGGGRGVGAGSGAGSAAGVGAGDESQPGMTPKNPPTLHPEIQKAKGLQRGVDSLKKGESANKNQRGKSLNDSKEAQIQAEKALEGDMLNGVESDYQAGFQHLDSAMHHALASGDHAQMAKTASAFMSHANEYIKANGDTQTTRGQLAAGLATASVAAAAHAHAVTGGQGAGVNVAAASTPELRQEAQLQATEGIKSLQNSRMAPLDAVKTARDTMSHALQSGDRDTINAAQSAMLSSTARIMDLPDSDPAKNEGMAIAASAYRMSSMGPSGSIQPMDMNVSPAGNEQATPRQTGAPPGSAEYREYAGNAQNMANIMKGAKEVRPNDVQSGVKNSQAALAIARQAESPGHIIETGQAVEQIAQAATRMDATAPETATTQMDVAETLSATATGYDQAAAIYDTYASDLMTSSEQAVKEGGEGGAATGKRLRMQAEQNMARAGQMRSSAQTLRRQSVSMANRAYLSARTATAVQGTEVASATLSNVGSRMQALIGSDEEQESEQSPIDRETVTNDYAP
jgi:hypothetical protein